MIITTAAPPRCRCGADAHLTAARVGDGIFGQHTPFCRACWDHLPVDEWGNTGWKQANLYVKEHTVTTPDTTTLADRLAPLASRYADLSEQIETLKEQQEEVKAAIRDLVPGPDAYAAGDLTVTVAPNRRFDAKKALPLIPENLVPLVTYPETTIDKEKLRVLAPEIYEAAQVTYAERISVKATS